MFERFTDRARRVLVLAQEEARVMDHPYIGTEHILAGLIHEGEGIAAKALESLGISLEAVREKVAGTVGVADPAPSGSPPFTPRAKKVLELSLRETLQLGHSYIDTEHMLLGLVRDDQGADAQILIGLGVDPDQVRAEVHQLMSGHQPGSLSRRAVPTIRPTLEAKLVSCSFCARQPPESGRLVSGTEAFICEHCVRKWARDLGRTGMASARGAWIQALHEVRPTGPPPEDQGSARTAIAAGFSGYRTLSDDGQSLPMVERGENLGPTLVSARARQALPETAEVAFSIDEIAFVDAEHAAVWFTISIDGRPVRSRHRGDAVVVDGTWKMARSTFCALVAMAGVACPPDTA